MSTEVKLPPAELVMWETGVPDVPKGGESAFWCAVKPDAGSDKVWHRFLRYANAYVMPLSDNGGDPPVSAVPVGDDGDYEWTGWFEFSCDHCDTQWSYTGEVIAWMKLPRLTP